MPYLVPNPYHVLQIHDDPAAVPKLSALLFKLRTVMTPLLTGITAQGADNAEAAAAEVTKHFTQELLQLARSVLKVQPSSLDQNAQ